MGEYARLTEFNIKATKENGDTPQSVKKQLEEMYAGGADKLSSTSGGLFSTIKGSLTGAWADAGLKTNEKVKPVMQEIIKGIESMQQTFEALQIGLANGVGRAITWIKEQLPTIQPIFSNIFNAVKTTATTVVPIIGQALVALGPVFTGILSIASFTMQGIAGVVKAVGPVVGNIINALKPVFKNVGSSLESMGKIFKSVFDGIKNVVEKAYNFVKPLIDGIGNAVSGISGAVSSGLGWIANKIGKNATGTKYWRGGLTTVGEHGKELVQLPSGSKVYSNTETNAILNADKQTRSTGGSFTTNNYSINLNIDGLQVREEADIDKIANTIVSKLQQRRVAFGG